MSSTHASPVSPTRKTTFSQPAKDTLTGPKDEKEKKGLGWLSWQTVADWWSDVTPFEWDILLASTCLKLLLFPA